MTKQFISQSSLARRLGVCPGTIGRYITSLVLQPDAVMLNGDRKEPTRLFSADRIDAIKAALTPQPQH